MKNNDVFDALFWRSLKIFIGVVLLICLFPIIFTTLYSGIDFSAKGQIGDTIGGTMGPFIAIAAAGLTFLAFWVQYKANEQQRKDIGELKEREEKEKLETKFFEMIKLHRDNVSELSYTSYNKKLGKFSSDDLVTLQKAETRKVFKVVFSDFKKLNKELNHFFAEVKEEDIYEEDYLKKLRDNATLKNRSINLVMYAKIDILYCILYFGLSSDDQETIKNFFIKRYNENFYEPIIQFASLKPKEESDHWRKWDDFNKMAISKKNIYYKKLIKKWDTNAVIIPIGNDKSDQVEENELEKIFYPNNFDKYYGGHQFRLGHYFRQLYQAVIFINKSQLIDYNQKYSNIKLLRAQLSTFEQSIIFLNSISVLGRIWEFEYRDHPEKGIDINDQLITKYNFIKNILNDTIIDNISVSHFYPLVEFEANFSKEKKGKRDLLEKKYS